MSMLPAGLVWGHAGAVDGTMVAPAGAYGVTPAAAAAAQPPLVYCYSPATGAAASDVTGVQVPASLTYHHQLQQQQQQQMLLAAKYLQQQQQAAVAQQMYVQTGLGLQPCQLPGPASLTGAAGAAGLQLHAPLALAPNLPYLSADQLYLPASPSAAAAAAGVVTSTGIAMTSSRKVRLCPATTDSS